MSQPLKQHMFLRCTDQDAFEQSTQNHRNGCGTENGGGTTSGLELRRQDPSDDEGRSQPDRFRPAIRDNPSTVERGIGSTYVLDALASHTKARILARH
jgi:hypothetical protein